MINGIPYKAFYLSKSEEWREGYNFAMEMVIDCMKKEFGRK